MAMGGYEGMNVRRKERMYYNDVNEYATAETPCKKNVKGLWNVKGYRRRNGGAM